MEPLAVETPVNVPSDEGLLRAFVESGSETAFEAIVRRYRGFVYGSALRQLRDPANARKVLNRSVPTGAMSLSVQTPDAQGK